jgi:hypothetical protein
LLRVGTGSDEIGSEERSRLSPPWILLAKLS